MRAAVLVLAIAAVGCDSSWHPKSEEILSQGSCTWKQYKASWSETCSRQVPHYHSSGSGKTRRTWTTYSTEYYTVFHPEKWRVDVWADRERLKGDFDNKALYDSVQVGGPVTCRVVHSWEEHVTKEGKVDEGRGHEWKVVAFWPYTGAEGK